jgi:Fur family ferric uptake transcriptional regulator
VIDFSVGLTHAEFMSGSEKEDMRVTISKRKITDSGLRMTSARRQLIEILAGCERPQSVEDLSRHAKGKFDLVTIYRNLEVFRELGVVEVILLENGKTLFELTGEHDHSHHIVCRHCLKTERIEFCMGGELERYASSRGYSNLSHTIEVFGECPDCDTKR